MVCRRNITRYHTRRKRLEIAIEQANEIAIAIAIEPANERLIAPAIEQSTFPYFRFGRLPAASKIVKLPAAIFERLFMSLKRKPTDADIEALAEIFRPLWREGDIMRPWLRQHHELLRSLVHGESSWAAVGAALTKLGITYRTGKPWTEKGLRSELSRALMPLKGYRQRQPKPEARPTAQTAIPPGTGGQTDLPPIPPSVPSLPPAPAAAAAPRFKPASFRIPESSPTPGKSIPAETAHTPRLTFGPSELKEPS